MSTKTLFIIAIALIILAGGAYCWSDYTKATPAGIKLGQNLELASAILLGLGVIALGAMWAVSRPDKTDNK